MKGEKEGPAKARSPGDIPPKGFALALNAVNRAAGEIRRSFGPRVAAKVLPDIFAMVGITIPVDPPLQPELEFTKSSAPDS